MNNLDKIIIVLDVSLIVKEITNKKCDSLSILYPIYKYIKNTFPQVIPTENTLDRFYSYINYNTCKLDENLLSILEHKLKIIWETLMNHKIFITDPNPLLNIIVPESFNKDINFVILIFYIEK